jgi:penicillin amidase
LNDAEQTAWKTLKQWNYYNDKSSKGAPYFEVWWNNLMPMIWDEMEQSDVSLQRPKSFTTIALLQEKPDFIFFDLQGTPEKEKAQDIIRAAFSLGVKNIQQWKRDHPNMDLAWGPYKDSFMRHLLRLEPLSIHVNAGGNSGIVNAHSRTNGPSWRMVVSLEKDGMKAWGVYPGGQSGNPGSKHYGDMIDYWTEGKHFALHFLNQPDPRFEALKLNPAEK